MAEGLQQKTGTTYEVARTASERGWLRQPRKEEKGCICRAPAPL